MTNETRHELPDLEAMCRFGEMIAGRLRIGDVVALKGGLGKGKTTLARAIIAALGHEGEVPSPTFTIIESYDGPQMRVPVVHADFYRLDDPDELEELGIDEYREGAALIAEWPDRAGGFAQEAACLLLTIVDAVEGPDKGRIAIAGPGADWLGRWP